MEWEPTAVAVKHLKQYDQMRRRRRRRRLFLVNQGIVCQTFGWINAMWKTDKPIKLIV